MVLSIPPSGNRGWLSTELLGEGRAAPDRGTKPVWMLGRFAELGLRGCSSRICRSNAGSRCACLCRGAGHALRFPSRAARREARAAGVVFLQRNPSILSTQISKYMIFGYQRHQEPGKHLSHSQLVSAQPSPPGSCPSSEPSLVSVLTQRTHRGL